MTGTRKAKPALIRAFTDNLGIKVLAMLCSLGLFSLVHGSDDAQRTFFVDVLALLPPPSAGRVLMSEIPDKVKVTVRGSRSLMSLRREDLPPLTMDLRDGARGRHVFDPAEIELPAGVKVVQLSPASVNLAWAKLEERRATVRVPLLGRPPSGFVVREPIVIEPSTVRVRGPSIELARLDFVETEPIDVSVLGEGRHERSVALERVQVHTSYTRVEPIRTVIEIVPEIRERVLRRLEVVAVGGDAPVLRPSRASVTLRGPAGALADLDPDQIVPFVDLSGGALPRGPTPVAVRVRGVPTGVEVAKVEPPEVLVSGRR